MAKERKGELPKGTVAEWQSKTPDGKLPEYVNKKKNNYSVSDSWKAPIAEG